jgi:hypothetical protein
MKAKILLTALFTFLLVNGNAFQKNSSLDIDVAEHPSKTYVIEMGDGTSYETSSDIRINNLKFGRNGIQIFKRTYRSSKRGHQKFDERLIYSGAVNIPRNSIVFSQLRNRELLVNNVVPKNLPNKPNNRFGMHQRRFQNLIHAIEHESFDRDRLEIMSQATLHGSINSRQVLELMDLLTFDSYKLKFAKIAYHNTVDKRNFFMVREGLTFISSRRKLTQFINKQSHQKPNKPRHKKNNPRGGRR